MVNPSRVLEDGVFVGGSSNPNTIRLSPPAKMPETGVIQLKESLQKAAKQKKKLQQRHNPQWRNNWQ